VSREVDFWKAKVPWKAVCVPKVEGGLGIRRIKDMNKALMASLMWSIISNRHSLWVAWINDYRLKGRSFWECREVTNCCWSWKQMMHLRTTFQNYFWSKLGNGNHTSAWFDKWHGEGPLCKLITPRAIHAAGFSLQSKAADICQDGSWRWSQAWRNLFPVLINIDPQFLVADRRDTICWKLDEDSHSFSTSIV
jgi:hypothetical protein